MVRKKKTSAEKSSPKSGGRTRNAAPPPPSKPKGPPEIEARILGTLTKTAHAGCNVKQLFARCGFKDVVTENEVLVALKNLVQAEKIEQYEPGKYRALRNKEQFYEGIYETPKEGSPFVRVGELDAEVALVGTVQAFPGDHIRIRLETESAKNKYRAKFVSVVRSKRASFVGTLMQYSEGPVFLALDSKIKTEFMVAGKNLNGARTGERVVARLLGWRGATPEVEITQVLGKTGVHEVEINTVMLEFDLPGPFPKDLEAVAQAIPRVIPAEEIARRRDFRQTLTLTIDPEDAKDFDDAISFVKLPDGGFEIGVHIADVTYYLKENTALDAEAYDRATSIYLVDRTIPMLPEILSNDLCSLRPNEDRLTYSAVFNFTKDGNITKEWFGRTIIHSQRRFTYEEVQTILENQSGEFSEELLTLNRIAHVLRKDRFAAGSINFESDEVKFKLDENGKPLGVYKKVRKDAHKLVEDYMLLANRQVASYIARLRKEPPIPFPYRIHAVPDSEKLRNLRAFVRHFGYDLNIDDEANVARSINEMVLSVEGRPEQGIIQSVAIRTMPKAIYTTQNVGHYGLGFKDYAHFTSPIRRYPDVLAHRLLTRALENRLDIDEAALELQCKHSSERERRAAEAERASIKSKQVEYLTALVGQEFNGMISGVTEWGMYVELDDNKCEGMIGMRDMTDDTYALNDSRFKLVGKNSGRSFALGDRVRVCVKKTNLMRRLIDFTFVKRL